MVEQVNAYLKESGIDRKQFARGLECYLGEQEDFDKFYYRHYHLLKGDYKELRAEEEAAYRQWLHTETNRHEIGSQIANLPDLERIGSQIRKWLQSGVYRQAGVKAATSKIIQAGKAIKGMVE